MIDEIPALLREWDLALKVLGALAAPGGLWFWIDRYNNRVRLVIRRAEIANADASGTRLTLVVENVGSNTTSAGPNLTVAGLNTKRYKFCLCYRLEGDHTKFVPFEAVNLNAAHGNAESETLIWAWYFVVTIPLSRGRPLKIRYRNVEFQRLSFSRFHWERFCFLHLKRTPDPDHS